MPVEKIVIDALNAQLGVSWRRIFSTCRSRAGSIGEGLPELTKFFAAQAAEEHAHAMKFLTYVQDVGGPGGDPGRSRRPSRASRAPRRPWPRASAWEEDVTAHIHAAMDLAIDRRDHATQAFLQWFVTEQVEEVATMSELLQVTRRAGESDLLLLEDYVARSVTTPA